MSIDELHKIIKSAKEAKKILQDMGLKYCIMCEHIFPLDGFNTSRTASDGRYSYCLECAKKQRREYSGRGSRSGTRKPFANETRPSKFAGCVEVRMYGDSNRWMVLDLDVFEAYSDSKFYLNRGGEDLYYCQVRLGTKLQAFHRLICDVSEGFEVDHINHNGLDNRRANLREVTRRENLANRRPNGYSRNCEL